MTPVRQVSPKPLRRRSVPVKFEPEPETNCHRFSKVRNGILAKYSIMSEKQSTRALIRNLTRPDRVAIQVIEPYTWAWIGEQLANGVVSWIGAQIFSSLVGNMFGGGGGSVGDQLRKMIEQLLVDIRRLLEEFYTRQRLDDLKNSTDSLELRYKDYVTVPDDERLLYLAYEQFTLAVTAAKNLDVLGFPSLVTIVSLGSSIYQELAARNKREAINLVDHLYKSVTFVHMKVSKLRARHLERFSGLVDFKWADGSIAYSFLIDGHFPVGGPDPR